jgi:hypothetical protein
MLGTHRDRFATHLSESTTGTTKLQSASTVRYEIRQ